MAGRCMPMMHSPFSTFANRLLPGQWVFGSEYKGSGGLQNKIGYDDDAVCPWPVLTQLLVLRERPVPGCSPIMPNELKRYSLDFMRGFLLLDRMMYWSSQPACSSFSEMGRGLLRPSRP